MKIKFYLLCHRCHPRFDTILIIRGTIFFKKIIIVKYKQCKNNNIIIIKIYYNNNNIVIDKIIKEEKKWWSERESEVGGKRKKQKTKNERNGSIESATEYYHRENILYLIFIISPVVHVCRILSWCLCLCVI